MRTRESCFAFLACALAACAFDGSGTGGVGADDDPGVDAADVTPPDARAIDAAPPPPPPPVDAAPPIDALFPIPGCDLDRQCEAGEDEWCPDCGDGDDGYVCNFDDVCDAGEHEHCLDCLSLP